MSYCTQNDILNELDTDILIQLTDDADEDAIDAAKVAAAIDKAEEEIDGYCGMRYSVPFATVPGRVLHLCVDIAIYHLYARRQGAPEQRQRAYDNAVRFLRDVSAGKASLGENDPDGAPAAAETPQIAQATRIFSRDDLKGF